MSPVETLAGVALGVTAVSIALSWAVSRVGILDAPTEARKTQKAPVPTSGGVAIAGAIACGCLIWTALEPGHGVEDVRRHLSDHDLWPLVFFCAAALTIGVLDDVANLSARTRFALLAAISLFAAAFGPNDMLAFYLPFGANGVAPPPLVAIPGVALWLFVMMNAVNFIDGANGIAMGSLAVMFAGLLAVFAAPSMVISLVAGLALAAFISIFALIGFLVLNLQGRLFAGDAGALFGGAVFGSFGLMASMFTVWFPAALALPILVDVLLTMLWRARRGENLLAAHNSHAYQLFRRAGWGHVQTAAVWWAASAACAGASVAAVRAGPSASFWTFWALTALLSILWWAQRRIYWPRVAGARAPA